MNMLSSLFHLLRIKHYVKNVLVAVPLICSGKMLDGGELLFQVFIAFISYSLAASSIYIINDIIDRKKDANHPLKKSRAIASGAVSLPTALIVLSILVLLAAASTIYLQVVTSSLVCFILGIYFILNLVYSLYLKHVPVIEVAILASGFLLRVIYGGLATGIQVSEWLYLTVLSASFCMGLGKRRNELSTHARYESRKVLSRYTRRFLTSNMYMFLAATICFYSLWAIQQGYWVMWSIPLVMIICMRYSLIVEGASDGDPVNVILGDKSLLIMGVCYAIYMLAILYFL